MKTKQAEELSIAIGMSADTDPLVTLILFLLK